MRKLATVLALGSLVTSLAGGCAAKFTDQQRAAELASFDQVYKTVLDRYFRPQRLTTKPVGIGWTQTYNELRPRIERARTSAQAKAVIDKLIEAIEESHFGVIPASAIVPTSQGSAEAKQAGNTGTLGIVPRIVEGEVIVFRVIEATPASAAGIKPGSRIDRVGNVDLAKRLRTLDKAGVKGLYRLRSIVHLLDGPIDKRIDLTVTESLPDSGNESGKRRRVTLTFAKSPIPEFKFGNLPQIPIEVRAAQLAGNTVGYFHLSSFFDPPRVFAAWQRFIEQNLGSKGIIIDLRGNPGGIGVMAIGLANQLVSKPNLKLGTMSMRDSALNFVLNPKDPVFTGPVAVLVDEYSASTSEILASGLRDIGRARIFGSTTAGMALPSVVEQLPNGDSFQFATADYVSESGQRLEGVGVKPDEPVRLTRAALLVGSDPVVDAAVRWINQQARP